MFQHLALTRVLGSPPETFSGPGENVKMFWWFTEQFQNHWYRITKPPTAKQKVPLLLYVLIRLNSVLDKPKAYGHRISAISIPMYAIHNVICVPSTYSEQTH